jgi:succinoglycan biosynthesis protein ExoA
LSSSLGISITLPQVSVIVPCYNEQDTIGLLLDAIYSQSYPRSQIEVLLADGLSTDQTRERIHTFQQQHPDLAIRIIDNSRRVIPSALNRAIENAQGESIIRLDAHSVPAPDYIERCQALLQAGRGDNVGGVWQIRPGSGTWIARAIAAAASHPLGVGDAIYRLGGKARQVDTVPFGAFHRALVGQIGPFDERLLTNEDYEFNTRIRQAGGVIWFDPDIRSIYFARSNIRALARQYSRYGYWKAQMLRQYPKTLRWRQLLPPLFVTTLLILLMLAPWWAIAPWLLLFQLGLYTLAVFVAGLHSAITKKDPLLVIGLPLAIATMHLTWGAALLWGLISPSPNNHRQGIF